MLHAGAARLNPYAEYAYDGLALNPLEVMFVKVKGFQVQGQWASAHLAATYQRWLESNVRPPTPHLLLAHTPPCPALPHV
jgi:hypothetical protein